MDTLLRFTDLRAIGEEIGEQTEYARVRTAIDKAISAQSCLSDLVEAASCAAVLDQLLTAAGRRSTKAQVTIEAAMLRTAVTLYERTTAVAEKRS